MLVSETSTATFAEVVRDHQSMVFSIAYHFLRDRAAAEEVAQDVFVDLHRHWDVSRPPDHVKFWLRRVASHRSIDYARRTRHRSVSIDEVPEPAVVGEPPDVLLRDRLRALLAGLDEKPRMVMVLRYQEDLMPEEIARVLEMPVATVKSHLQRSLKILREKVK